MKRIGLMAACLLTAAASAFGEVKIAVDHNKVDDATPAFSFKNVPAPAAKSAASDAKIRIVDGDRDEHGAGVQALRDGHVPGTEDEPSSNFFFAAGSDGGRIVIDLGRAVNVKQVNTYSWHSDSRAPQVYALYGNDGDKFEAKPNQKIDPVKAGWKLIAKVDTRIKDEIGGQFGVSISDSTGNLGSYKALLMVVSRTDEKDDFSHTFYSEVVVVDADAKGIIEAAKPVELAKVDSEAIRRDISKAYRELKTTLPELKDLLDEAKRKDLAPKVEPIFRNIVAQNLKLQATDPQSAGQALSTAIFFQSWLSYLGDEEAGKFLTKIAADEDDYISLVGKVAQQRVRWFKASGDAKAQQLVLADMGKLADEHPGANTMVSGLVYLRELGAATPELADAAEAMIAEKLTSADAKEIRTLRVGKLKQKAAMNKPFVLAGPMVDGKDFSTASLKGKVILIDFWATWCRPCIEEHPRIKGLYAKYHDKGFEIVGVSCDGDGAKLAEFVKKNEIPWTQMWDKTKQSGDEGWHALATEWGVLSIPQMFLIDRNGNLRSVEARSNMEELIPKLLDEKANEK